MSYIKLRQENLPANLAADIATLAEKSTLDDDDLLLLADSADGNALKKVRLSALKTYAEG